ncbi:MAG: hypothetical protein IKG58_02740 [Bacilli bacterium]|nr:hypothetical protein [Bacilli bacterium]
MKKFIKICIVLIVLIILIKYIFSLLETKHNIKYNLLSNKYNIEEIYRKEDNNNNYYFTIKKKKNIYTFIYKNNNNKKKIINNIKEYKSNSLKCILPIYKDNNISDIYCLLNNKQVSSSYLKESNNKNFKKVLTSLSKDKYKLDILTSNKNVKKDYISIYQNNLKDYKYVLWFYKGIYVIDNKNIVKKKFLKNDKYDNNLSALVGNYYVIINTDLTKDNIEYKDLYVYDLIKDKEYSIKLENKLSINTYINGVYNNLLYLTDNDSKVQYSIDPKTKKVKKVGDRHSGFVNYSNGKVNTIRKNKDNIFSYYIKNKKISKLYGDVLIRKYKSIYYFRTKNGNLYQIINNNYKHPVLLFRDVDMKEWKLYNDSISFISDNKLYYYDSVNGLKEVILNNEFRYNSENIYDFIKK